MVTSVERMGAILNDEKKPLKQRFRALFTLRSIGGKAALDQMLKAFDDPSALLKHEVAFCIGQMGNSEAVSILEDVLSDNNREAIVRHEAGEALGAIGKKSSLPVLRKFLKDQVDVVADTCELAIARIEWLHGEGFKTENEKLSKNPYESVDPAPPAVETDAEVLTRSLVNEKLPLFDRYRAMFSLRNKGDEKSIMALTLGLKCSNVLLRHEVAYVLGQSQSELAKDALIQTLRNIVESEIVRHECAEALGSIGTRAINEELAKYLDPSVPDVLRESCVIALDVSEYNNSEEFLLGIEKS